MQVHVVLAGAMLYEGVDLDEGIWVQQRVDAFAGRLASGLAQLLQAGSVARAVSSLPHGVKLVAARVRHGSAKCESVHQQDGYSTNPFQFLMYSTKVLLSPCSRRC